MSTLRHVVGASVLTALTAVTLVVATLAVPAGAAVAAPKPTVRTTQSTASVFWPAVKGAQSYVVCLKRTTTQKTCTASGTTTRVSHVFRNLTPTRGTDYRLTVRATAGSSSATSASVSVVLQPPTPKVSVRTAQQSIAVTWAAIQDVDRYEVCLVRTVGQTPCTRQSTTTGTSATFGGLTPVEGTDYHVVVRAFTGTRSSVSAPAPAELNAVRPGQPTAVAHRVGFNSAVITWKAAANATAYDVCLTTTTTSTACEKTTPRTTGTEARVYSLASTPGTDYTYVVRAHRGTLSTDSARGRFDLPVPAVTTLAVEGTTPSSLALDWSAVANAETYVAEISTAKDLGSGKRTVTTTSPQATFEDLAPGVRYYARVRGVNSPLKGAASATVTRVLPTSTTTVRVVTYNLCGQDKCRASTGLGTWKSRKTLAAKAALGTNASIISTQESGDKDTNFGSVLPGFRRAAYQSAKSLFYKSSDYTLNRSGSLTLDSARKRYAVWAELVDKASGTPFIVVDPHLEPYKGKSNDDLRYAQTRRMLSLVDTLNTRNLDVVYAGDMNSNKHNATYPGGYDAVRKAFLAAKHADTLDVARRAKTDEQPDGNAYNVAFNSANQGRVTPIRNGDHVDAIYTSPGVGTRHWKVVTDLATPTRYRTPFASDHNPLTAMLTMPGRPELP
ncbi:MULTISPECIES: fibronectin type III domain-containing protein [unclassified Aeromicrobium]|uniref:fibronectin type III domain-containing protein n=1 Tax=unclassified Aeromicrobium TaxID=2633570 RepID=UPI00288C33CC|nr:MULTISPECIES: fibronectin type III domain-containing protein [unclassified Aeromicrobium]